MTTVSRARAALVAASLLVGAVAVLAGSGRARASERRFAYTYESAVLPAGQVELEPHTTWRVGRDRFYNRLDERLELELGLTSRLQTAFYLNFSGVREAGADGQLATSFELGGVSSEWKLRLLDPVADAVGLALYGEITVGPEEEELEAKLILDRRFGNLLVALNLVAELEIELEDADEAEVELAFEADLGIAWFFSPSFALGVEIRGHNIVEHGELESSAWFAGPTVSYARRRWWFAMSVLPQIIAAVEEEPNEAGVAPEGERLLDLTHHERLEARVVFGVHL